MQIIGRSCSQDEVCKLKGLLGFLTQPLKADFVALNLFYKPVGYKNGCNLRVGSGKSCHGSITGDFNLLELVVGKTYVRQVCVAKVACVNGPLVLVKMK